MQALFARIRWRLVGWNMLILGLILVLLGASVYVALSRSLLDDARARFPDLVTDAIWRRRHSLIETLPDWHAAKDGLPATLAHDDFNQRNIGFRPNGGVVVLDWELVGRNIAQRDLAEMLVFVLSPTVERAQVDRHIEAHRLALVEAGIATGIELTRGSRASAAS